MRFYIDEQYMSSVTIETRYNKFGNNDKLTDEELLDALVYKPGITLRSVDHPVFDALRGQLERDNYIETERAWWNGDRVIKKFYLNRFKFDVGDVFPCASAMKHSLNFRRKYKRKYL